MARLPALPVVPRRGTSPNEPECGWWLVKWRRNSAEVPAAIWRIEHEPGEPDNILDTGPIFVAAIAGEDVDPLSVWTMRKRPISEAEYRYRVADQAWLRRARPTDPKVAHRQPVDLKRMPSPW
jgi:hypothetical protein